MPKTLYATFEVLPGHEETLRAMMADEGAFAAPIGSAHGRAFNEAMTDKVVGGGSQVVFLNETAQAGVG